VRADRERLQQVAINLASNAVKFTERGGRIALSAEPDGDVVRIHVRDTGAAFRPTGSSRSSTRSCRWKPGSRAPCRAPDSVSPSRAISRGMDGDVTVESAQGEGSDFVITLPRAGD
jgi:signal transduction histidine kinase